MSNRSTEQSLGVRFDHAPALRTRISPSGAIRSGRSGAMARGLSQRVDGGVRIAEGNIQSGQTAQGFRIGGPFDGHRVQGSRQFGSVVAFRMRAPFGKATGEGLVAAPGEPTSGRWPAPRTPWPRPPSGDEDRAAAGGRPISFIGGAQEASAGLGAGGASLVGCEQAALGEAFDFLERTAVNRQCLVPA